MKCAIIFYGVETAKTNNGSTLTLLLSSVHIYDVDRLSLCHSILFEMNGLAGMKGEKQTDIQTNTHLQRKVRIYRIESAN